MEERAASDPSSFTRPADPVPLPVVPGPVTPPPPPVKDKGYIITLFGTVIGALTGSAVVAFILLTGRLGMRLYPVGGAPWRRLLFPIGGSLGIGYLLYRYFPNARGSGVPQTKAALFAREGARVIGCDLQQGAAEKSAAEGVSVAGLAVYLPLRLALGW